MAAHHWTVTCPWCLTSPLEEVPGYVPSLFAWSKAFTCRACAHSWRVCARISCAIPSHTNVFYTRRQCRDHARYWHGPLDTVCVGAPLPTPPPVVGALGSSSEQAAETDVEMDGFADNTIIVLEPNDPDCFLFGLPTTAQFSTWCIEESVTIAVGCVVHQALVQEPISRELMAQQQLAPNAIHLFLNIAKMLVTTGTTQHPVLAVILDSLLALIPEAHKNWPTLPSTLAGFQSHVLNPTNRHSLIAQLPMPRSAMLKDKLHAYCCVQEIAAFVLLLPLTKGVAEVPLRLQQLCNSKKLQQFRSVPTATLQPCLVTIHMILWMDGWDPSASSKNNRSPVHTASVTLLCVDNSTNNVFNARTFPISCGPGKADHNVVFQALQDSLTKLEVSPQLMWSNRHQQWTYVRCQLVALLKDQPERRGSNNLLGGNSLQHALFALSCHFENLQRCFASCTRCRQHTNQYVLTGDFTVPLALDCNECYSFSVTRLVEQGQYRPDVQTVLPPNVPGAQLALGPGQLTFSLLKDAWQYAMQCFVYNQTWSKKDVESYFNLLCINKAATDHFLVCCGNFLLAQHMDVDPEQYGEDILYDVGEERVRNPEMYALPTHPAAWNIGTLAEQVETLMHLAMNTQKAVFKLLLHWSSDIERGPLLKKRLQPLIQSVQSLRLPYIPARMFKNAKFGGYVAENYRALTHLSPWLFHCLTEDHLAPRILVQPPATKPRVNWTIKENRAWLKVRGVKVPSVMPAQELRDMVGTYFATVDGPPPVLPSTTPTVAAMRELIFLLFRVFGALFATDLKDEVAGNRFEALAIQFLDSIDHIGRACHPDKTKPIWQSKYGLLGLLRCRQHFIDFTCLHSLYEGGIEGEGMVKELRPLCPNAVKSQWSLNLMNAYNRQTILASMTQGFEISDSSVPSAPAEHNRNCRRYASWADVNHAWHNRNPISIMVLGSPDEWSCHVLVHMYQTSYTRAIIFNPEHPYVDTAGYVYHSLTLDATECVFDISTTPLSFGLLLPNLWGDEVLFQYAVVDKEWRYVDTNGAWTHLG
jgi:hypothetical protein